MTSCHKSTNMDFGIQNASVENTSALPSYQKTRQFVWWSPVFPWIKENKKTHVSGLLGRMVIWVSETLSHDKPAMFITIMRIGGFPGGASGKEPACQCRRQKRCRFDPWVGRIPWKKAWQSIPVFLPRESHGQRSLVGCSPWGRTELDTTEWLSSLLYSSENELFPNDAAVPLFLC